MNFLRTIALALAATAAGSQSAAAQQPVGKPRLAVVVEVDGLTTEALTRYRANFTGGLGRMAQGAVFTNVSSVGSPVASIATRLQQGALRVGVSGASDNDFAGFDQGWAWDGSRFAGRPGIAQPRIIPVGNEAIARLIARAEPALTLPPACIGATASSRFARAAGDFAGFAASPAVDGAVLAIGAGLAAELRLGADSTPDLLVVRLPATARVAATHGPASEASCLQLHSLDRDLAGFFAQLDRGGVDYAVALAGSSMIGQPVPLLFWRRGMVPYSSADPVTTADLGPTLAAWLGVPTTAAPSPGRCLAGIPGIACPR